jgi:hypothetical protein
MVHVLVAIWCKAFKLTIAVLNKNNQNQLTKTALAANGANIF